MSHVLDLNGILLSAFVGQALLALVILLAIRPILARLGFQRWVWNPPLAEFGLGICILGIIVLVF
jgi:hypothetical protein